AEPFALERVERCAGKEAAAHLGVLAFRLGDHPMPARVEHDRTADAEMGPQQTAAAAVDESAADERAQLDDLRHPGELAVKSVGENERHQRRIGLADGVT